MAIIRVKICGLTRRRDALLAERLGADFLGFVFYRKSPRYISPHKAGRIVAGLDPVTRTVGVFVNEKTAKILDVGYRLRLDFVQLHGSEKESDVAAIQKAGFKVIKAVPVGGRGKPEDPHSGADLLLFDSQTDAGFGGTGVSFNPRLVKNIRRPLILAGGLNAGNIRTACRIVRPYAIDVSSGVEVRPGIKSPGKLRDLFKVMDEINGATNC